MEDQPEEHQIAENVDPNGLGVILNATELSADLLARRLRLGTIRVFGRIQQDEVLIDVRSVLDEDDSKIALALRLVAGLENNTDSLIVTE